MLRRALVCFLILFPTGLTAQQSSAEPQLPSWFLQMPVDSTRICGRGTAYSSLEALTSAVSDIKTQVDVIREGRAKRRGQAVTDSSSVFGQVEVVVNTWRSRGMIGDTLIMSSFRLEQGIASGEAMIKRKVSQEGTGSDAHVTSQFVQTGPMSDIIDGLKAAGVTFKTQENPDFRYFMLACLPRSRVK